VEIAIHIETAEHPFNRVNRPVLVAIELLEMVVGQFRSVRVRNACPKMIPTGIVALWAFQHAVVHEIGSRLHDGFRRDPFADFYLAVTLTACRLGLCGDLLGLPLKDFRLLLWNGGYSGFSCGISRRLLSWLR
jgi:hypothetical protein